MSDSFHVSIPELNAFVARFKGAERIVEDELGRAGKRAGLLVEAQAKTYAPVDTGNLRRSITSVATVSAMGSVTKVGTNVQYARAVEFGRGAGKPMPPPGVLLGWMRRKGIAADEQLIGREDLADVAGSARVGGGYHGIEYLVARAIGRRGIPARPFLFKAFNELRPRIQQEFAQVPKRIIARLQGGG